MWVVENGLLGSLRHPVVESRKDRESKGGDEGPVDRGGRHGQVGERPSREGFDGSEKRVAESLDGGETRVISLFEVLREKERRNRERVSSCPSRR